MNAAARSPWSRRMARVAALACCSLALACAPGVQLEKDSLSEPGQLLFNGYGDGDFACFPCHNGDARGTTWGPDLLAAAAGKTDEQLEHIIITGRGGMPSFKEKVSPEHMRTIIAWLRGQALTN